MLSSAGNGQRADQCKSKCQQRCSKNLAPLRGFLRPVVDSKAFEITAIALVLVSMVVMGVEAEINSPDAEGVFLTIDRVITALFLIEWCMRVVVGGSRWFSVPANWVLTFVVFAPLVLHSMWVMFRWLRGAKAVGSVFRWLRGGKIVLAMKEYSDLKVLRMLLTGLFGSTKTLIWSCALLAMTTVFFGVFAIELIGNADVWVDAPEESAAHQFKRLGTSMMCLTRFLRHDNAAQILHELRQHQPSIVPFFLLFQMLGAYVLMNLVTAVIVDRALHTAGKDEELAAWEEELTHQSELDELEKLFEKMDIDGSGRLSKDEFDKAFQFDEFKHKLEITGIDENELRSLFAVLDADGTGEVDVDEFTEGIPKLFGDARSYDMLVALKKSERVINSLQGCWKVSSPTARSVGDLLGNMSWEPEEVVENTSVDVQLEELRTEVEERLRGLEGKAKAAHDAAQRLANAMKLRFPIVEAG